MTTTATLTPPAVDPYPFHPADTAETVHAESEAVSRAIDLAITNALPAKAVDWLARMRQDGGE